jgi:fatty-acyl-CoA synthase
VSERGPSYVRGSTDVTLCEHTIGEIFDDTARRCADDLAVVSRHQQRRLSYAELAAEVNACARGLRELDIEREDRVGLWSPNCIEWIVVQLATARIGAILVTINPAYRCGELEHALNLTQCKALVLAEHFKGSDYLSMLCELAPELAAAQAGRLAAQRLPALRWVITLGAAQTGGALCYADLLGRGHASSRESHCEGLRPQDPINIQFTSGTTGLPKGATLTHFGILNNAIMVGRNMRFTESDRLCLPVPLYHCFGMVMGVLNSVAHGAAIVLPSDGFDPKATLKAIAEERCTALYGVPTMFIAELADPECSAADLSSLRTGIMAGAPCPVAIMKRVITEMHMPDVVICYGMTETSPVSFQTSLTASLEHRVATVGQIQPQLEAKLIDTAGRCVPLGETGELLVRGYSVMRGYWNEPERSAAAVDEEGWMHTGDLATIDAEGYCRIVGRCKDMIIRGGENIYPAEIEQHLHRHPAVEQAAVFGVPDEKFGEIVCAWIVAKAARSVSAEELAQFCRSRIAHYKVPAHIRLVGQMPATVTGKLKKYLMRQAMVQQLGIPGEAAGDSSAQ